MAIVVPANVVTETLSPIFLIGSCCDSLCYHYWGCKRAEFCRVVNVQARFDSKNRMFKLGLSLI